MSVTLENKQETPSTPPPLAWEAHPFKELLRLTWPIALSMLSYATMTLVDTLFVARLGTSALAGVGLGGIVAFTLVYFGVGLLRAVKILTSQAIGGGRPQEVAAYLGSGLALALAFGVLVGALAQLVAFTLPWISATESAGSQASAYLQVRMIGSPLFLAYVALREYRYGFGDSRSPMWAAVSGNVVNIGFDWLFLIVLKTGVTGAAWATVIGHAVELAMLGGLQVKLGLPLRAATRDHVRALWRTGWPVGLQGLLEVGAFSLLTALLAALSETDVAAHQIAVQAIHFAFLPVFGMAEASAVLAGQAVGANQDDLVLKVTWRALALGTAYALFCTLVLGFGAEPLARAFTDDAPLVDLAVKLFLIAAAFQLLDAATIVARSVLQGTGDVRYPAAVCISSAWLLTPPLTWWWGYELELGAVGGWLSLCAEIVVSVSLLWWRLLRHGWKPAAARSRELLRGPTPEQPAPVEIPPGTARPRESRVNPPPDPATA